MLDREGEEKGPPRWRTAGKLQGAKSRKYSDALQGAELGAGGERCKIHYFKSLAGCWPCRTDGVAFLNVRLAESSTQAANVKICLLGKGKEKEKKKERKGW